MIILEIVCKLKGVEEGIRTTYSDSWLNEILKIGGIKAN